MARSATKWLLIVALFMFLHVVAMAGLLYYMLDNYYDQPKTPIDPVFYALAPLCLLGMPDHPAALLVLLANSALWGFAIGTPFAGWFGWIPIRFTLRGLLLATTVAAIAMGLVAWLAS